MKRRPIFWTVLIGIIVIVFGVVFVRPYTSSPGFVSREDAEEFYRTSPQCRGVSILLNRESMMADASGVSVCIGFLIYPNNNRTNIPMDSEPVTLSPTQPAQAEGTIASAIPGIVSIGIDVCKDPVDTLGCFGSGRSHLGTKGSVSVFSLVSKDYHPSYGVVIADSADGYFTVTATLSNSLTDEQARIATERLYQQILNGQIVPNGVSEGRMEAQ